MVPAVTALQMKQVDDLAVKNGLLVIQMMEHAALGMARLVTQLYPDYKKILILAGPGHNGGDGIACARFLKNWGYEPEVVLSTSPEKLKDATLHHLELIKKMGVPVREAINVGMLLESDLIVDALLGYSVKSNPRKKIAEMIHMANESELDIISFDNPSGLDVTDGLPYEPCVKAKATLTLALPKTGLLEKIAREYVGELYLADLGIPKFIYDKIGVEVPDGLFKEKSIIKI